MIYKNASSHKPFNDKPAWLVGYGLREWTCSYLASDTEKCIGKLNTAVDIEDDNLSYSFAIKSLERHLQDTAITQLDLDLLDQSYLSFQSRMDLSYNCQVTTFLPHYDLLSVPDLLSEVIMCTVTGDHCKIHAVLSPYRPVSGAEIDECSVENTNSKLQEEFVFNCFGMVGAYVFYMSASICLHFNLCRSILLLLMMHAGMHINDSITMPTELLWKNLPIPASIIESSDLQAKCYLQMR